MCELNSLVNIFSETYYPFKEQINKYPKCDCYVNAVLYIIC